jgi:hypothetical protein
MPRPLRRVDLTTVQSLEIQASKQWISPVLLAATLQLLLLDAPGRP